MYVEPPPPGPMRWKLYLSSGALRDAGLCSVQDTRAMSVTNIESRNMLGNNRGDAEAQKQSNPSIFNLRPLCQLPTQPLLPTAHCLLAPAYASNSPAPTQ